MYFRRKFSWVFGIVLLVAGYLRGVRNRQREFPKRGVGLRRQWECNLQRRHRSSGSWASPPVFGCVVFSRLCREIGASRCFSKSLKSSIRLC